MQSQENIARFDIAHNPSNQVSATMMLPSQPFGGLISSGIQTSHAQTVQEDSGQPKANNTVSKKRQRAPRKKVSAPQCERKSPESLSPSPDRKKVKTV